MAVIGSGPAGLAVAAELNKLGHRVTVYERDEGPGGLLRFGVPDAKLEKWIIDRRVKLLEEEGIEFRCDVDVGRDVSADELRRDHDAGGGGDRLARAPRPRRARPRARGRALRDGVPLPAQPRGGGDGGPPFRQTPPGQVISAAGKRVVVVGGGDTGMDCISNALREGAEDVLLLDVYPQLPASGRPPGTPWPLPPKRTPRPPTRSTRAASAASAPR